MSSRVPASGLLELTAANAVRYLKERGVLPPQLDASGEELGGGISNVVIRVTWRGGCLVVKQSLPKLRVEADWPFDRSRIFGEERCARYLATILPSGSVPEVLYSDPDNYTYAMSCAPAGGVLWKQALLDGDVDPTPAERAARLLARIHVGAAVDAAARAAFADQTVLIQGRVDPYHRAAADANPDLADVIEAEIERLVATQRTLVLGDYCPKNTYVYRDRVLILDFEVAHWGDPGFDVAFCLNHLVLKACLFRRRSASYLRAARRFWDVYAPAVPAEAEATGSATVRELGCLLLARIDGKSKIEYITDEPTKDLVRSLARELLLSDVSEVNEALHVVQHRLGINEAAIS